MRTLIIAIAMTIVLTLLTGIVYPLVVWGVAQVLFPWQAQRQSGARATATWSAPSLSARISPPPRYFHPRPSAAGDKGYDASNSSGSNLGPTNRKLIDATKAALHKVLEENPGPRRHRCRWTW